MNNFEKSVKQVGEVHVKADLIDLRYSSSVSPHECWCLLSKIGVKQCVVAYIYVASFKESDSADILDLVRPAASQKFLRESFLGF